MKSFTLKVYPHKFMNDVDNNHFKADSLAHTVSQLVLQMLEDSNVLNKNLSSNEGYEFEIHNPNCKATIKVVDKILLIFPSVSKRKVWIEFPIQPKHKLGNIERRFQEDAIDAMDYGEEDWMSY